MILGLDISTSCIGMSLYEENGTILVIDHLEIKPDKNKEHSTRYIYKGLAFKRKIEEYYNKYGEKITNIFVEAPLESSNNQMTVIKLAEMNAVCCYIIKDVFKIEPTLITVSKARAYFLPEYSNTKKIKVYNNDFTSFIAENNIKITKKDIELIKKLKLTEKDLEETLKNISEKYNINMEYIPNPYIYETKYTLKKIMNIDIKELILQRILQKHPQLIELMEYDKNGNPKKYFYDIADSCVVSLAGLKDLNK